MGGSGAEREHQVQVCCQRSGQSAKEPQQLSWPPLSGSLQWFPLCPGGQLVKTVQQGHPDAWAPAPLPQASGHTQQVKVHLPHLDPEKGKNITKRENSNFS